MPYVKSLDGVRALSILLVILTHTAPLGPKWMRLNEMTGPMGMSLFFCLSGFLIVSIIHRNPDPWSFLIRRVLRIVPGIALYLLVLVILFGIGWRAVVENLLFVANYNVEGRGRGEIAAPMSHLWSLSVEMQFYVAIAALTLLMGRRSVWLVPPAALVITALRIQAGPIAYASTATHLRLDEILAGGTLALVAWYAGDRIRAFLSRPARAAALLAGVTLMWMVASHPDSGAANYTRAYLTAILVGIVMHSRLGRLHDILESRPAAYVARISYALYIYHPLMVFGWMNAGSDWVRYLLKRPVSFVLMWAAAHASTFWWEHYWQRLARRLTGGHAVKAGA